MDNRDTLREFGRLRYVEPSNIWLDREGTFSDAINFPYEDYNMAVDLTISQTNRYSCGWWTEDGGRNEITYSSDNGTISFLGGTRGYSSMVNEDDSYLTTNFTDISLTSPDSNTSECLGIESINITYNSWFYPQVVIKFVDVRGATVMLPAEKGYYNPGDVGNASAIYKALFSFPYPMFKLKVKGFYGKGVTYRLAIHKSNLEFDANTGNFNITVEFIGYMYGIYSEIPMTFLAAAPFMERGKVYWDQKVSSGEFTFRDEKGMNGTPMITIPELSLRLAQAAQNEIATSAAAEGVQVANTYDERYETIVSLKDTFPFATWFKPDDIPYSYGFFKDKEGTEEFFDVLSGYITTVSAYDYTYNTHYVDGMTSLVNIIETLDKKYKGDKDEMLDDLWRVHYVNTQKVESGKTINYPDIDQTGRKKKRDAQMRTYNNSIAPYDIVKAFIESSRGSLTDFYILALPREGDYFNPKNFYESVKEEEKKISEEKQKQVEYYKSVENGIIEKVLGFKPSIKNVYDLMFAHMDTFMHCFYESTKVIKDQLEQDQIKRAKSTYDIKDGETDTEREEIKASNGSTIVNTNARCKFLPPYAAYYKQQNEGEETSPKMVLRWLEELPGGSNLEEVSFINELLAATEMYFDKADNVNKQIELLNSSGTNRVNVTFSEGTPSFDVSEFIPLTVFDFINKDKKGNPYKYITSKVYNGDKSVEGEILTTFALRAFYYLATNADGWADGNDEAYTFGKIEAINLFKSVRDRYSDGFVEFIKKYADGDCKWSDKVYFVDSMDGAENELCKTWKTEAPNLNNALFASTSNNSKHMVYNYHKGFILTEEESEQYDAMANKKYVMFPLYANSFNTLQNYYTKGKEMLNNPDMIPTDHDEIIYGNEKNPISTFVLYNEARDYIKNLYTALEDEITKAKEEIVKVNAEYGNRDDSSYGKISKASSMLKEYMDNIQSEFGDDTYVYKVITDRVGKEFKKGEVCKIISTGDYNELKQLWIKYPSIDFSQGSKTENSIFSHPLYEAQEDIRAKAYLFIQSVPIAGKKHGIDAVNKNGLSLKTKLLREGAYYWYEDNYDKDIVKFKDNNGVEYKKPAKDETLIASFDNALTEWFSGQKKYATTRILKANDKNEHYVKWEKPEGSTASRRKVLKKEFEDWATSNDEVKGFAANEGRLTNKAFYSRTRTNYKSNLSEEEIKENQDESKFFKDENSRTYKNGLDITFLAGSEKASNEASESRKLQDFLRNLFFSVSTTFDLYNGISTNSKNVDGIMMVRKSFFKKAIQGFMKGLKDIYGKTVTDIKENTGEYYRKMAEAEANNPFNSIDLKLATYMTVKSLYDKWLCSPYNGPMDTWALTRRSNSKSDFDNFKYADTYYNDIGYKLIANISKVSNWLNSCMPTSNVNTTEGVMGYTGRTLYEFLTGVAQDCGGTLMALPQKFGLTSSHDIKNMFSPLSIKNDWDEDSSTFIFMYTYQPSAHLGDNESSSVDMNGWSPKGDGLDLTDDEIVGKVFDNTEGGFIVPSFGVTYGKQNQSIFKNIQLSTNTQGVTEASIAATMNIAAKGAESPRESTLYGQDLYRVFSNYCYSCSVETMGNTQILPMMYFQLNNIPMWKGAYMIKKVTHSIKAGDMTTTFEGIRQNRYAIPFANGAVIISKNTGEEKTDDTPAVGGDGSPVSGINGRVEKSKDDTVGNPSVQTDSIDFDEGNVTEKKPIICITPAHGPKTSKPSEWEWSSLVVDEMFRLLSAEKYSDGTPYNVQRCNKNGNHTAGINYKGSGYSMEETKKLISKYGSKKVISLVPHWNGGEGQRFEALKGGKDDYTRPDSIKLLECIVAEAKKVKERAKNGEFPTMPEGAMDGTVEVNFFPPRKKNGVYVFNSSDGATMVNCACALSENWFADYPDTEAWERASKEDIKDPNKFMAGWLFSTEGVRTIAKLNADGIKRYINTL